MTSRPAATVSTDPVPLRFAVSLETFGQVHIAAWAFAPHYQNDLSPAIWLFCIPGATYRGNAYYDRQLPGSPPSLTYSMARAFASNGIGLVVIDNLGTGESRLDVSTEGLTPAVLAGAYTQVVHQLRTRLQNASLVPGLAAIPEESLWLGGVGHSMGAFILIHLQGRHSPFDGATMLGMTFAPQNVAAVFSRFGSQAFMEKFAHLVDDDVQGLREIRVQLRPYFYSSNVPQTLVQADEEDAVQVPIGMFRALYSAMSFEETKKTIELAAHIHTPVYIGLGALEVPFPREEPAMYRSNSITLFVQPEAAHCANFEQHRMELWADLISWCRIRSVLSNKHLIKP